jgi:hypothetical protein
MSFPRAYKADGGRGVPATAFLKGRVVSRTGGGGTPVLTSLMRMGLVLGNGRFDEVDHLGLIVELVVMGGGEGERNRSVILAKTNVEFEDSWILLGGVIATFEKAEMLIPTSIPGSIGTIFVFGGAKADVIASSFDPKMLGELSFTTVFLFESFDVEDLRRFGAMICGIDFTKGEDAGISI